MTATAMRLKYPYHRGFVPRVPLPCVLSKYSNAVIGLAPLRARLTTHEPRDCVHIPTLSALPACIGYRSAVAEVDHSFPHRAISARSHPLGRSYFSDLSRQGATDFTAQSTGLPSHHPSINYFPHSPTHTDQPRFVARGFLPRALLDACPLQTGAASDNVDQGQASNKPLRRPERTGTPCYTSSSFSSTKTFKPR